MAENKNKSLALSIKKNGIEFLREFESSVSIFKTALAHESGDPGAPFNKNNRDLVRLSL
jgi:hypothetical protein